MKAIAQIIDYLRDRGELSRSDLQWLAGQGFLPWEQAYEIDDFDGSTSDPGWTRSAGLGDIEADRWDFEGFERPRGRRKRGKRVIVRKGSMLEAGELCSRLAEAFGGWREELDGLMRVARRVARCGTWAEAALTIRNAESPLVFQAVRQGLEAHDPTPAALSAAIGMARYRVVVEASGPRGPAVAAYRAILDSVGQVPPNKYAWLLKEPEICKVVNLRVAQDRLRGGARLGAGADLGLEARTRRRVRQAPRNPVEESRTDGFR